ncbi:hypothetical protein FRC11_013432, partial [Ceratobasidium sp. 423]
APLKRPANEPQLRRLGELLANQLPESVLTQEAMMLKARVGERNPSQRRGRQNGAEMVASNDERRYFDMYE